VPRVCAPLVAACLATLLNLSVALQLPAQEAAVESPATVRTALFVVAEGVYNSELMAPYDVLQHSVFRDDKDYIATAIVSADGKPFTTFEGITVMPHYSFASAPKADILVIPCVMAPFRSPRPAYSTVVWPPPIPVIVSAFARCFRKSTCATTYAWWSTASTSPRWAAA